MASFRLVVAVVAGAATVVTVGLVGVRGQSPHQQGRELYLVSCASCHGASLEGQPDWQVRKPDGRLPAPPHNASGHTWHHSDAQLFLITKDGLAAIAPGYESDMPAFKGKLSDGEISAILEYIKSTWPERERAYQASRP